jgi:hypothetical protein
MQRKPALLWKDCVSTAPIFADFPPPYPDTADENTVMTDFWLDFVSVRRSEGECPPGLLPELEPKPLSIRERMKNNLLFTALQRLF